MREKVCVSMRPFIGDFPALYLGMEENELKKEMPECEDLPQIS